MMGTPAESSFTHHDPLEDTEREVPSVNLGPSQVVSPITIRLRILKESALPMAVKPPSISFTHHDPLEDTESVNRDARSCKRVSFTHHDPLEDTESAARANSVVSATSFHPSRSA